MKLFGNTNFSLRLPLWAKKKDSIVSAERVTMDKRLGTWIHYITPEHLGRVLERFARGDLEMISRMWAEISDRDDTLITVIDKRVSSVAQLPWEVVKAEGDESPEAEAHKEALKYLYDNLTATSIREPDETGGVTLLLEQMMEAASTRYAVHELIWQPDGKKLTVTANHLPLWYFENRTGKLRYRPDLFSYDGIDLEPNQWMVTVGRGLMKAASIAYLCKHLPLKDWVIFSSRFGMPGVLGKTPAAYDSPEWNQMVEIIEAWIGDRAGVINSNAQIEQMELKTGTQLPYETLLDRMDRAMARMYTGGDLSTLSRKDGVGATSQSDEFDKIRNREAARLSETLNEKIDGPAIQWLFGTKPLAWFQLKPPAKVNVKEETDITEHLVEHGAPVSIASEVARFGRSLPAEGEPLLTKKVLLSDKLTGVSPQLGSMEPNDQAAKDAANEAIPGAALQKATAADHAATLAALHQLLDGQMTDADLRAFQAKEPELLRAALRNHATVAELEKIYGTAVVNGLLEATQKQASAAHPGQKQPPSPRVGVSRPI